MKYIFISSFCLFLFSCSTTSIKHGNEINKCFLHPILYDSIQNVVKLTKKLNANYGYYLLKYKENEVDTITLILETVNKSKVFESYMNSKFIYNFDNSLLILADGLEYIYQFNGCGNKVDDLFIKDGSNYQDFNTFNPSVIEISIVKKNGAVILNYEAISEDAPPLDTLPMGIINN